MEAVAEDEELQIEVDEAFDALVRGDVEGNLILSQMRDAGMLQRCYRLLAAGYAVNGDYENFSKMLNFDD